MQQYYNIKIADPEEGPKIFRSVKTMAEYIKAHQKSLIQLKPNVHVAGFGVISAIGNTIAETLNAFEYSQSGIGR